MERLRCPDCGNTARWGTVKTTKSSTVADCGICGKVVVTDKPTPIVADVIGNMTIDY